MNIKFGNRWAKTLEKRIEGFEFEVGIIEDKPHKDPVEHGLFGEPQLTTYVGEPLRKTSRNVGPKTTAEIFVENQERINTNLLWEPFQNQNDDLNKFTTSFLMLAMKVKSISVKRVENLLQAVVRNPILRKEYGSNSSATADAKGFDRHLFDTGQMFKAIKARVKRRV